MSADSFHHMVESEEKKLGRLYDFIDFVQCVEQVGIAIEMKLEDFRQWENQLSQGKASKENRPLLDSVNVAQFRKGSPVYSLKKHTPKICWLFNEKIQTYYRESRESFLTSTIFLQQNWLVQKRS